LAPLFVLCVPANGRVRTRTFIAVPVPAFFFFFGIFDVPLCVFFLSLDLR